MKSIKKLSSKNKNKKIRKSDDSILIVLKDFITMLDTKEKRKNKRNSKKEYYANDLEELLTKIIKQETKSNKKILTEVNIEEIEKLLIKIIKREKRKNKEDKNIIIDLNDLERLIEIVEKRAKRKFKKFIDADEDEEDLRDDPIVDISKLFRVYIITNVDRIAAKNITEVIEYINNLITLNEGEETEENIYTIQVVFKLLNNRNIIRTDTISNRTLVDIKEELEKRYRTIKETYGISEEEKIPDNVEYFFLKEITPVFGAGSKEQYLYFFDEDRIITVYFPSTYVKCLVDSVYNDLEISKKDRFYNDTKWKDYNFRTQKEMLEAKFNIHIKITQSEASLLAAMRKKKDNEVILFGNNFHVGFATYDEIVFDVNPKELTKEVYLKSVKFNDMILAGVDCEYGYAKNKDSNNEDEEDDVIMLKEFSTPQEPNLVCLKYLNKGKWEKKEFKGIGNCQIFLEALANKNKKTIYLFSHNAQKVENIFFLRNIVDRRRYDEFEVPNSAGLKIKSFYIKVSGTGKIKKGKEEKKKEYGIHYFDSLLYLKASLETLAKQFETTTSKGHTEWPDLKTVGNVEEFKDNWYLNKKWDWQNQDDVDYCMNDVTILLEVLLKFNETIKELLFEDYIKDKIPGREIKTLEDIKDDFFLIRPSISSILRSCIFRSTKESPCNFVNTPQQAALLKKSFYGGLVNAAFIGEKKKSGNSRIFAKDVNSFYPSIMSTGIAGRILTHESNISLERFYEVDKEIQNDTNRFYLVLAILRNKRESKFPVFAKKDKGKLLNVNVLKKPQLLWMWNFEYKYLLERDNVEVHDVKIMLTFESMKYDSIINKLYIMKSKCKNNKAMYNSIKIILNGMFGSLGMDPYRKTRKLLKSGETPDHFADVFTSYNAFEGYQWITYEKFTESLSCFQAASSITAQARLGLIEKMEFVDSIGCQVLYSDTDSIYFYDPDNCYTKEHEFTGDKLGEWDQEELSEIEIWGCKMYRYKSLDSNKDEFKFKGLSHKNISKLKKEDIKPNCSFINEMVCVDRSLSIKTFNMTKTFSLNYDKGTLNSDGTVTPFTL